MKRKHNKSSKTAVQGMVFVAHPLYIHTYIHVANGYLLNVSIKLVAILFCIQVVPGSSLTQEAGYPD
jgi:hypothetical protein